MLAVFDENVKSRKYCQYESVKSVEKAQLYKVLLDKSEQRIEYYSDRRRP